MHAIMTEPGAPSRRFDLQLLAGGGYEWVEGDQKIVRAPGRLLAPTMLKGHFGMLDDNRNDSRFIQFYWASEVA